MIVVLGAGAFGTALAISLARDHAVTLWARDPEHAVQMQQSRENTRRLPGVILPRNITVCDELETVSNADAVLLAVPMQRLRALLVDKATVLAGTPLVACCKGIELATGLGPTQIISEIMPEAPAAILTGPSFAADIAKGLPTALTLACKDKDVCKALQSLLSTSNLRLYRTTDTIGAELGGALKNVMAIGSGVVMGAGLGESARAALMTRGFAEMCRMAAALGARPDTLSGLSGFGDLVLTCTSDQSRNTRFGHSLGRNEAFDPTITVEGAATARAVCQRAADLGIDMPVTRAITALMDGELQLDQAMDMLLSRPLKEE